MLLEGQFSGFKYNIASYRGAAKYILDAFDFSVQEIGDNSYQDIVDLSASNLIDEYCPDFLFDDGIIFRTLLEPHVERERFNLINKISGTGGQAILLENYKNEDVDDILLEKSLDFIVGIEFEEDYEYAVKENVMVLEKCNLILKKYGYQISTKTLASMQDVYYGFIESGKYTKDPITNSAAGSALSRAWDGIGEWRS